MTKEIKWDEGLCNCGALRQAARYVTAAYDQVLAESGLRALSSRSCTSCSRSFRLRASVVRSMP